MLFALPKFRARMPVVIAVDAWILDIKRLSVLTQQYYTRMVKDFLMQFPKKYVNSYLSADVRLYLNKIGLNHENSSTNNHLKALRSFFNFCSENYNNITNPTFGLKKRKEKMPHRPFISKIDLEKILSKATPRQRDIILILAHTGLRASELCSLRPENISPNLASITITGKGGKVRTIPCNQTVKEILSRSIQFPKNRKSVYIACRNAGDVSNLSLTPHMLRRYLASRLLHAGVSLLVISRILGHSSVRTTEIYLGIDSSFLLGVTDCLD